MSGTLNVRGLEIGTGLPKLCISIDAARPADILSQASRAIDSSADMVEWRADYFSGVNKPGEIGQMLRQIRQIIGEMPLLFTAKTSMEGGGKPGFGYAEHKKALLASINSGVPDIVDIEFMAGKRCAREMIDAAHLNGMHVIVSCCNYLSMPSKADILLRLHMMLSMGADMPKFAANANNTQELLDLLGAASEFTSRHTDRPVIVYCLGSFGNISKASSAYIGNAICFCNLHTHNCCGQLSAPELKPILKSLHIHR